jgi:type III secretory pathway component EscT
VTTPAALSEVPGVLLAALRLLPTAILSPFLGGPLVPPVVRIGLAVALGWAGLRVAAPPAFSAQDLAPLLAAVARELSLGVALGVAASLPVEAARAGGRLVDTLRGATLSELHVAPIRQRESATGDLLAQWCVVLAAWGGGDRLIVQGLLSTFTSIPLGGALPPALLGAGGLRLAGELLSAALSLAAPAAAGIFAADLAIALVERFAPGLGTSGAAQPARAALGVAAVALAASAIGGRLVALVAFAGRAPVLFGAGVAP